MSLNVEDLLKALDNENNTGIAGLTTSKIKKEKTLGTNFLILLIFF